MNAKRPLWIVCLLLPLAALALWGASRVGWADDDGRTHAQPALVPLALLALASAAAVLAMGPVMRRIMGALFAIGGLIALVAPLIDGGQLLWGRALSAISGALIVAAGTLLVLLGHRMPRLGSKYRTPKAANESTASEPDLWRALSEGDDPTARES